MDRFIIEGGHNLKGEVKISGAKNAALPILIATLLTDETCVIENIPALRDINTTIKLLEYLGKKVYSKHNTVTVKKNKRLKIKAPYNLVKQMRASFLVAGPLLSRYKKTIVPLPGGCAIGLRPVDMHLEAFSALGAQIETKKGDIVINAKSLQPTRIKLSFPSVGATENILLCAVGIPGKTVITNYAKEPEIIDLINFLNSMGADISFNKTEIIINGVKKLFGAKYKIMPDRIEAATYLLAAAVTSSSITVSNCEPKHLKSLLNYLSKAGLKCVVSKDKIKILKSKKLCSVDVLSKPHPGFATDILPLWTVLMIKAKGQAKITERIFENRFMHIPELARMGALIAVDTHTALIDCTPNLLGASVMSSDLRGGAALVIAGLLAKGKTTIDRIYHIDRGYEKMEKKLSSLGAKIERVNG